MAPRNAIAAAIIAVLVLAGCGNDGPDTAPDPDQPAAAETSAGDAPSADADEPTTGDGAPSSDGEDEADADADQGLPAPHEVSFVTPDGETLSATVLGSGDKGIVLAHMRGRDRTTWLDFAEEAAAAGYHVLAFDFRGYGASTGVRDTELDVDVLAAINALADMGATRIVAMGASMGGTAVINVASSEDLAGAASLSAPAEFQGLPALDVAVDVGEPLLVVAAEDDQPYADAAIGIDDRAPVSQLRLFSGNAHGTNLFGAHGDELTRLLLSFAAERLS